MQKLFKILSLFTVAIGIALGITALKQNAMEGIDIQETECPICMVEPVGENKLEITPCCQRKLCRKCLGQLETKYPRGDFEHQRGFKECPFCRKDITQFAEEHAFRPQPGSISYLLKQGCVRIISEGPFGLRLYLYNLNINDLTGLQEIPNIRSITSIILSNNQLTTLPERIFAGLSNLEILYLDHNPLRQLRAGVFDDLTSLKTLSLNYNDLTTLPEGIFSRLSNLEKLSLSNNHGLQLRAGMFDELTHLKTLSLNHNDLTTLPEGIFSRLRNLEELNLIGNRLTTLPEGIFSGLRNLKELTLQSNPGLNSIGIEDKVYTRNDLQDLLRRLSTPPATSPRR